MVDRRQEIINETGKILVAEGYNSLTIQRIAERVDITSAGVHYHFETKEDLVVALIEDREERLIELLESTEGPPDERLADIIQIQFEAVETVADMAGPPTLQLVLASVSGGEPIRDALASMLETYVEIVSGVIREGVEQGVFESDDPERMAVLLASFENAAEVRTALDLDTDDVWDGLTDHVLDDLYVKDPPERVAA